MLAKGQITVSNIDDGKTPFIHQAYKMKDGRFLKHYPVYEAPPVNGYKAGDLWHKTDGSQPGYFVANKSNTTLNLNDWTFYANELSYSDTDKFYPKFEGTYSDYNEVASDDQTKYTWKIIKADDGVGIKSVKEYYAVSASNVTPPSLQSDWSETPKPTNTTNKYLWNYEVYTYSNGDVKETNKRVIGTHGTTGATGNGITSVTNRYLATTLATGVTTATSGWTTTVQKTDSVKKYLWNYEEILYTNGTKIPTTPVIIGTHGEKGDKGSTGVGIKDIQEFYLASPLGEGVTRSTDGWTSDVQAIDSDKKYLWNYEKINYDNNTNYLTAPVIIGTFGSQGIGVKGVTEYYLASPLSEGIRKDTNGWTTEMQPLTPENKYLWNKEIIHYTDDESALKDKTEVLSGTEIFTDKADADAVVHVEVDGKSYQHAGSGKNLCHKNTFTGTVFSTTETTNAVDKVIEHNIPISPSSTYTLSGIVPSNLGLNIFATTTKVNESITGHNSMYSHVITGGIGVQTTNYKVPVGYNYVTITTGGSFQKSYHSIGTSLTWSNIQLEEGSVATAYEPPALTPDYPIAIHSLNDFDVVSQKSEGGTIDGIEIGGRNLLPLSDFVPWASSYQLNGHKFTVTGKNSGLKLPNTHITSSGVQMVLSFKARKISGSVTHLGGHTGPMQNDIVTYMDGEHISNSFLFEYIDDTDEHHFVTTFTTGSRTDDWIYIQPNRTHYSLDYVVEIWDIKLEKGSKATDWTPAPEDITENDNDPLINKINLSLSEPLRSVGDVKDMLFRDTDGLWKVERKTAERIIDGGMLSYRYRLGAQGINTFYSSNFPNTKLGYRTSVSSHFKNVVSGWDRHEHGVGYSDHISSVNKYFYFPDSLTGISESDSAGIATQKINNWLALNPIIVVYQLANPVTETLSQPLQDKLNNLRTFKDSNYLYTIVDKTNILPNYVSENLKPNLHATFKSKAWSGNNAGYPSVIGVYGDSAKMLYLSATAESMTFNADGTPNPSSQVITLTANLQNVSGNASFAATAYNGSTVVSNVALSGVGNTRTFNQAQFPASANRVQVRATLGNLVDTVTIVKLANGSNGQNAVVGLLTNESITLPANKDGLVSSFTGATGVFDVYDGITKKTGLGVKYSLVNNSQSNITVNINATTGAYSVTAMPTGTTILNGFATLSAIYNGVTIEKQLNVSKSVTGATGASGKDGIAGKDGKGISSTTITYGLSTTDTVEPTSYTSNVPTLVKGRYLWTKTVWKYTDTTTETGYTKTYIAKDGNNGTDGIAGKDGVGIKSTSITYVGSTSGTVTPTSGWTTAVPTVAQGSFLWTRTIWTYTDNSTETGYSVARMGSNGATGATGAPGASATSYWITASNNIIGKSQTGVINPTTITFKGYSKTGTANSALYAGRFIIQTSTNGTSYTTRYTSSANQNAYTYTIPADTKFIKALFYQAGGTSVLLDEQTVPVVESAEGIEVGGRNLIRALNSNNYSGIMDVNEDGVVIRGQSGAGSTLRALYKAKTSSGDHVFSYAMKEGSSHRVLINIYDENEKEIENKSIPGWTWNVYYKGYFKQVSNNGYAVFNAPSETRYITGVIVPPWEPIVDATLLWMKLEKGNKATDWTPAPEDARTYKAWANSADGGADFTKVYPNKNLILETTSAVTNPTYMMKAYPIEDTSLIATDDIVITVKGSLGSDRQYFMAYNSGGSNRIGNLAKISDGMYQYKGKWNALPASNPNSAVHMYQYPSTGVQESTIEWIKLERGTTPTIYTTNPQDSLSGSIPKYVGFSPIDSDVPHEYEWIMNPEYAQALADEALDGKVDNDAEYENLKNMAQEVKDSYEKFVGENGEYKTEHNKLLERTTTVEKNLGEYREQINFVDTYMSAGNEGLIIGMKDSEGKPDANAMQMLLSNKSLSFMDGGEVVAYFSGQSFHINRGAIVDSLQIGQHKISNLGNGHTVFQFTG